MPVRLAVIGGSGLYRLKTLESVTHHRVDTPYGRPSSDLVVGKLGGVEVAFLARHGVGHSIPPHRINHRANVWALHEFGAKGIVATSSVGSLKREICPGSLVIPHDYLCFWDTPTFHDDKVLHATPSLDEGMGKAMLAVAKRHGLPARGRGVYAQTRGPRLETRAEIRLLADYADVVGMTMASEATLAAELGIRYAGLCSVDNYAHGVTAKSLAYEQILSGARRNMEKVLRLLPDAIRTMESEGNV